MAAGLAELVSRVTEGVTAYPSGDMSKTPYKGQYKAYWVHPGQTNAAGDPVSAEAAAAIDTQVTEYAYPSRAEATAAAVLLRYEEARARALAQPEPEKVPSEADVMGYSHRQEFGDEGAAVLAEQEQNYNAMIGESLRSRA
jgi:hypothetical protein